MRFGLALCITLILMSLAAAPVAAAPTTYYVAPDGNDNNPGTEAQPWESLYKALGTAQPGDTVLVKNGTWPHLDIRDKGARDQWLTFRAYPGHRPQIVGYQVQQALLIKDSRYLEFDGFTFLGTDPAQFWDGSGINIEESHNIRIRNSSVSGFGGAGINARASDHVLIENNIVFDNAKRGRYGNSGVSLYRAEDRGPDVAGHHNIIRGNVIYDNANMYAPYYSGDNPYDTSKIEDGNCIILDRHIDSGYTGSTLVENNLCFNNGGRGIHAFRSRNVLVRHNTLVKNQYTPSINDGELTAIESNNIRFFNNLAYTRAGARATNTWASSNIIYSHNLYYNTDAVNIPDRTTTDIIGQDPLLVNPSVNPGLANFRLMAGSPAINAATPDETTNSDHFGMARPQVGGYDIGAHEFTDGFHELLGNGGFDVAGANLRKPSGWKLRDLQSRDRRACDNARRKVSRSESCVFQFRGERSQTARLVQKFNGGNLQVGDVLDFSAWANSRNLTSAPFVRVLLRYQDGTRSVENIALATGTTDYQEYSRQIGISKPVRNVKVMVMVPAGAGRLRVEDLSMRLIPASAGALSAPLDLPAPTSQ